jgi:hypothetical protein
MEDLGVSALPRAVRHLAEEPLLAEAS